MKKILSILSAGLILLVASCGKDKTQSYLVDCDFDEEIKEKAYVVPESQKAHIRSYITENGLTAVEHPEGFFYTIIEPGKDTKVERCYDVSAKLKAYTFDGHFIENGTSAYALYAETTIIGFRLGMTTIGDGGKVKLYLPPALAYGDKGADPAIGPNEYLIFEVELLDARKKTTYY